MEPMQPTSVVEDPEFKITEGYQPLERDIELTGNVVQYVAPQKGQTALIMVSSGVVTLTIQSSSDITGTTVELYREKDVIQSVPVR